MEGRISFAHGTTDFLVMVRLFVSLHGQRAIWEVPLKEARHKARWAMTMGGAVYWSERC